MALGHRGGSPAAARRRPLRRHPAASATCAVTRSACAQGLRSASGTVITLLEWHAEHSLAEGLQRGPSRRRDDHRVRAARPRDRRAALSGTTRPASARDTVRRTSANVRSDDDAASRGLPAEGHLVEGLRASGRPRRDRLAAVDPLPRPGRAQADRARLRARAAPGLSRCPRCGSARTSCRTSGVCTSARTTRSTSSRFPIST